MNGHAEPLESRRLMSGGSLDTAFASAGSFERTAGEDVQFTGTDLDVGPRGEILVTSTARKPQNDPSGQTLIHLWKTHADGMTDRKFGVDGEVKVPVPADVFDPASALSPSPASSVITTDGSIFVAVGYRLFKFRHDGRLDRTFAHNGRAAFTDFADPHAPMQLDTDAEGRLYVMGFRAESDDAPRAMLLRLNPDGSLDRAFADGGIFIPAKLPDSEQVGFHVLPDGRIMVAGTTVDSAASETVYLAERLRPDGTGDPTYNRGAGFFSQGAFFVSDDEIEEEISLAGITDDGIVFWHFREFGNSSSFSTRVDAFLGGDDVFLSPGVIAAEEAKGQRPILRDAGLFLAGQAFLDADGNLMTAETNNAAAALGAPASVSSQTSVLSPDGSILFARSSSDDFINGLGTVVRVSRLFRDDAPIGQPDARNFASGRTGSYRFTVQYHDDDGNGIDPTSLGDDDITVSLPGGGRRRARLVSTDATGSPKVVNATYLVTSPDGIWDADDNGDYTIRIERRSVRDSTGHFAAQRVVGRFTVAIPT
jgi:uncharacterized delta-60 repeat protein